MFARACRLVTCALAAALLLAGCPMASAADSAPAALRPLFASDPSADHIPARDSTVAVNAGVIHVVTGHTQPWPGITLDAPAGTWDLSHDQAIVADLKNLGTTALTIHMRVDNAGADGTNNCITRNLTVGPGQTRTLRAELGRTDLKLFGMRGYPPGTYTGIDPARITALVFFLNRPGADHTWEIRSIRLEPATSRPTPFFPFIDTFGQYIHKDWPGKTHSLDEMQHRRAAEAQDLAAHPAPADWDQYGGWQTGPAQAATGYFRVAKVDAKWWLVDPDGKLFFSQGIDCVGELDPTPIEERRNWFQNFPGDQPEFASFLSHPSVLHGHYAGKRPLSFSFTAANLLRKYGSDWRTASAQVAHQRLRSWGLNTIGNWSSPTIYRLDKTPYVTTLSTNGPQTQMIAGSTGYWGKFPDPFAPGFTKAITERAAAQATQTADDPWCLGYFVDNEMSWGDQTSLAVAALQSPPDQPAKKVFVDDLKAKYQTIGKLNAAWGTHLASWDALLNSREAPDKDRARADLEAFYTKTAEAYFAAVKHALAQAAPHHLYLGCRFAWTNPLAIRAAANYCDVISFNLYRHDVSSFKLPDGVDKPAIIGEFHFGALDRGMFHTGLVATDSQADRAKAYRTYVESALRHPNLVGCHWFKYCDEPTTGRSHDGENYQIGFVDEVDTPYPETIEAARQLGATLYQYRSGH